MKQSRCNQRGRNRQKRFGMTHRCCPPSNSAEDQSNACGANRVC
jgi:hypothetical protein